MTVDEEHTEPADEASGAASDLPRTGKRKGGSAGAGWGCALIGLLLGVFILAFVAMAGFVVMSATVANDRLEALCSDVEVGAPLTRVAFAVEEVGLDISDPIDSMRPGAPEGAEDTWISNGVPMTQTWCLVTHVEDEVVGVVMTPPPSRNRQLPPLSSPGHASETESSSAIEE